MTLAKNISRVVSGRAERWLFLLVCSIVSVCASVVASLSVSRFESAKSPDVDIQATTFAPAVINGGHVQNLPAGDGLNIGTSAATDLLDVKGNGNQLTVESSGGTQWPQHTNGDTIYDFDPVPISSTQNVQYRFFRHTTTSGTYSVSVTHGTSAAGGALFNPDGTSYFDPFTPSTGSATTVLCVGSLLSSCAPGWVMGVADNNALRIPGTGIEEVLEQSTFDTSGGSGETYGVRAVDGGSRGSGTDTLTNVGVYASAQNGDTNLAIATDSGDVSLNRVSGRTYSATTLGVGGSTGPQFVSGAGAPSSGACGTTYPVGSVYLNTSGGTSTTLYVCTAASTWTGK